MPNNRDDEQDALIRQNADDIRRNADAIRRQTECLEKIRDHYFPKKTIWKRTMGFFLKVVGAATVAAGLMETGDWYWNVREAQSMAEQSEAVARRLFLLENDPAGAAKFFEKAVELDDGKVRYRIELAYVKGLATIGELFDLGRPMTVEERARVDEIQAEAVFLQEAAPDDSMPYVMSAQAQMLRGEHEAALKGVAKALELAPEVVPARVAACAINFAAGRVDEARKQLAEAERLDAKFPLVMYWKSFLLLAADKDCAAARKCGEELMKVAPRLAQGNVIIAQACLGLKDVKGAKAALNAAIETAPRLTQAKTMMGEIYEREGNLELARLWFERVLAQNGNDMKALVASARVYARTGENATAIEKLDKAIELAPFRADLYTARAKAKLASGDAKGAAADEKTGKAIEKGEK